MLIFPMGTRRLPRSATAISAVRVRYPDGRGILREVLREATSRGFTIDNVATETFTQGQSSAGPDGHADVRTVEVTLQVHGKQPVSDLAVGLSELENVQAVVATDVNSVD